MNYNYAVPLKAKVNIQDSPLAREDASAKKGDVGWLQDQADGYLFVDFGNGAILCVPSEVTPVRRGRPKT